MRVSTATLEFVNHTCAIAAIAVLGRIIGFDSTSTTLGAPALLLLAAGFQCWNRGAGSARAGATDIALDAGLGLAAAEILIFWF